MFRIIDTIRKLLRPSVRPNNTPEVVVVGSPLYVAVHEAGHAVLARQFGGVISEMRLFDGPPYSGKTVVIFSDAEQSALYSLGGFAAEQLMFEAGLIKLNGSAISETAFQAEQRANASVDFGRFVSATPGANFDLFAQAAHSVKPQMTLEALWPLAAALEKRRFLTELDIVKLLDG